MQYFNIVSALNQNIICITCNGLKDYKDRKKSHPFMYQADTTHYIHYFEDKQ